MAHHDAPGALLRISGLTKTFGGARALDAVDLTVPAGQVHALLGHNGAGKSTLIKCLAGAYPPDSGTIEIDGTVHTRLTPRESIAAGVAVVFQTLSVVAPLSVAENIFLGQEWTRRGLVNRRAQEEAAAGLLRRVGAACSPRDRVADLPMGQRQLVEIAKGLSRSAAVLVLDEPTAALSAAESAALAERVDDLRAQGLAIVYVTHLLSEVERLADAVTVLRDGRVVHQEPMRGRDRGHLVQAIAGSTPAASALRTPPREAREPQLAVEELTGPGFGPVSFRVAPGEIVGLFGLIGSGRTRLLETVFGRRVRTGGGIRVAGRPVSPRRPAEALSAGVALVPADRRTQGLLPGLGAHDNVLLPAVRRLARRGLRSRATERELFARVARAVELRPARPDLPAAAFSGGNQQKLMLGRWVDPALGVRVLLLDDPTQGVDVGARQEIYRTVSDLAARRGAAIVFASSDPEEVVALAHRALILAGGRVTGELSGAQLTEEALLSATHAAHTPLAATPGAAPVPQPEEADAP